MRLETIPRGIWIAVALSAVASLAALPASAVFFDFEDQIVGSPPNLCGVELTNPPHQIVDVGSAGVPDLALRRAETVGDLPDSEPLVMRFDALASSASMLVGHAGPPAGFGVLATLAAFDDAGGLVDSVAVLVGPSPSSLLEVGAATAVIREVHLTLDPFEPFPSPTETWETIDDLEVDASFAACLPDTTPPSVSILYPPSDSFFVGDTVALVAGAGDDEGLGSISWRVDHADGSFVELASAVQPSGETAFLSGGLGPPPIPNYPGVLADGENLVRATACDTALPVPNCTTTPPRSVVSVIPPDTVNFYVQALEITQAAQDEITVSPFTRGSGFVDNYPGLPLFEHKPTLARVYVGLEGAATSLPVSVVVRGRILDSFGDLVEDLGLTGPATITVAPDTPLDTNDTTQGALVPLPPEWADQLSDERLELTAQANPPTNFVGQAAPPIPTCSSCPLPIPECEDDPADPYTRCNDDANLLRVTHIRFQQRTSSTAQMVIVPVPINLGAAALVPAGVTPATLAHVANAYPVPGPGELLGGMFPLPSGLEVRANEGPLVSDGTTCLAVLRDLRRGFSLSSVGVSSDRVATVLGLLPSQLDCSGLAWLNKKHAIAWQGISWVASHEIGHNRGLEHASNMHGEGAGGGSEPWPHAHGALGYAGFDASQLGRSQLVSSAEAGSETLGAHEMMSYGGLVANAPVPWISPRNYVRMVREIYGSEPDVPPDRFCDVPGAEDACLDDPDDTTPCPVCYSDADCVAQFGGSIDCIDEDPTPIPPPVASGLAAAGPEPTTDGEFLVVSGEIDGAGALALDPIASVPIEGGPAGAGAGSYAIEIRDGRGVLAVSRAFEPEAQVALPAPGVPPPPPIQVFVETIPAPAEIGSVELRRDGALLRRVVASASAPAVEVLAPNGGELWKADEPLQEIRWRASDADANAKLSYTVLLSRDGGASWSPLAVDLTDTRLEVGADRIGGTLRALVRVIATDGLRSARDDSDFAFEIESKPQRLEILQPLGAGILPASQPLPASGQIHSYEAGPETRPPPGATLRFRSVPLFGGPQRIRQGASVEMPLFSGIHDLVFEMLGQGEQPAAQHTEVWVADALLELDPATLGAGGLEIHGLLRLPSDAQLLDGQSAGAVFEPNGELLRSWSLEIASASAKGGFPVHRLLDGDRPLGSVSFDEAAGSWRVDVSLPGAVLPPPQGAATNDAARVLLRLGTRSYAGPLRIDRDADGVVDAADSCIAHANADQADGDGDGLGNACDSCTRVADPSGLDSDRDGFGNRCDADYDQTGRVGVADFNALRTHFGETATDPGFDPDLDADADGAVGIPEFNLLRGQFGGAPGPSGLACAGRAPCR